jgi:hypothetical protein
MVMPTADATLRCGSAMTGTLVRADSATRQACASTMSKSNDTRQRLEPALRQTETDADASLKAAAAATKALKRFRSVIHDGNLREVAAALGAVQQTVDALEQQVAATRARWDFDETSYFASGAYTRELLETAERMQLAIFEEDDRLYCYPSLVRVLPTERTLLIDRTRERRLRPSLVVDQLRTLQGRPPRFRPDAFLEALFGAYRVLARRHGSGALARGPVERLMDVYELLTLLPGQSREYSRQEFARDIYLLDRSGVVAARNGSVVSFPASTGTKSSSGVITAITESGQERLYWGISFTRDT